MPRKFTNRLWSGLLILPTLVFALGILPPGDFTEQDGSESVVFSINLYSHASAVDRPATLRVLVVKNSFAKIEVSIPESPRPTPFPAQILRC